MSLEIRQQNNKHNWEDGEPVNCTNLELCTYLQVLADQLLVASCLDTIPSAPSRSMSIVNKSYHKGKKTAVFHGFQSLMMFQNSTESHGEDLSILSKEVSLARTSAQQEKAQELTENAVECGLKWQELSVKYCLDSSMWRTHQCLWDEDLPESSVTLPRWGMMRNGVLFQHPTLERPISAIGYGYEPNDETFFHTPNTHGLDGGSNSRRALKKRKEVFPTPTCHTNKEGDYPSEANRNTPSLTHVARGGDLTLANKLNPRWLEWLMGWPIGLSSLEPLAMDKFHSHMQQLGEYLAIKK